MAYRAPRLHREAGARPRIEAPMTSVTLHTYDYVNDPHLMNPLTREEAARRVAAASIADMPAKIVVMEEADDYEPTEG
ncbi:hypothetical protein JCM2811A_20010 [Methylorubrum rhodinum]